ncbi:Uma2 family endonuclease [Okeania sp.]|uniref:Uma2 family endonuclease n=1 Tax=Okeania sp. TaxID=3100323 RepID=UPI002B4ADA6B|nr:Uma2 family endonuclease [Okeania sp.]MEB3339192.1 Uma2 family endonuclease [Okeania sp.]
MNVLILNLDTIKISDEQFYDICQNNRELKLERNTQGELIIMSPVGGESGNREADLIADLVIWNRQTGLGYAFSSSSIFKLPNGSDRSPDAAWIGKDRWESLTIEERRTFPPIAPDFVLELRSATDNIKRLRSKMQEYMDAGVLLGWLINPQDQEVEIYRREQDVEVQNLPTRLSGEKILPGFYLILFRYLEI